jgi:hypothetical protein
MVHQEAIKEFRENDVELTVPPGVPRPVLIVVMVCSPLHTLLIYQRDLHHGELSEFLLFGG